MGLSNNLKYVYNSISWAPYEIGHKIYKVISSIEPGRFLEKHLAAQITFSLLTNYLLFDLRNDLMKSFGKMNDYVFKVLPSENANENDWSEFKSHSISIIQPLLTYIGIRLVFNAAERLYDLWLNKEIKQRVNAKVFNDQQVGIKLANSEATAEIVRNLPNDIAQISSTGLALVKNMAKATQDALLSFNYLNNISSPINIMGFRIPDLMLISFIYSGFKQILSTPLTKKMASINSDLTIQQVRTNTIMGHDFSNVKPIFTAKSQNTVSDRHKNLMDKTNNLNIKSSLFNVLYEVWQSCNSYTNMIFKNIILGYKIFTKVIKSDQVYEAWSHFDNVDEFFSWPDTNQATINGLKPSLERVEKFLNDEQEIVKSPTKIIYSKRGNNLELQDLTLSLNNETLVTIPKLRFKQGERYVISGIAGSGKSSIIAKINGIIHDGIDASGEISFPSNAKKTVMLTQDDYFPAHSSLLDILCLPGKAPQNEEERANLIKKAKKLLNETQLGREIDLEEKKTNYSAELSGGQKKKIKIVSAIIQNPDILLLDEVFTGLDKASIKNIQNMIKKYLGSTMIIAISHHPDESRGFYTSHHAVEEKQVFHKWGDKASLYSRPGQNSSISM